MEISFDPAKRARTLAERGLDFADAPRVFAGCTVEVEDTRREYGTERNGFSVTACWPAAWWWWVTRGAAMCATFSA
jgi:uncharacterized DUF497 family protein